MQYRGILNILKYTEILKTIVKVINDFLKSRDSFINIRQQTMKMYCNLWDSVKEKIIKLNPISTLLCRFHEFQSNCFPFQFKFCTRFD